MHFFKYFSLAIASVAVATSSSKAANAAVVLADIDTIKQNTIALNGVITPFTAKNNGLIQALKINSASDKVSKALKQTIKDANSANPFTEEESINIGLAIFDLNPNVITVLDNLKSKKPEFDKLFITAIVRNTLTNQRKLTVQLTDALVAKVAEPFKGAGPELSKPLLDKFDEVIAVFAQRAW